MSELVGDAASLKSLERMPLDESLYSLDPQELRFYQLATGITDESELKKHVLGVQAEAFEIFPYPCIRHFMFTKLKVTRYPVYAHVLEYGRTHNGAIFLEMACCYFWDLGFKLFKDNTTTFPVPFVEGDIFSPTLLDLDASRPTSRPVLANVKSLTELLGYTAVIHASAFFHLFSKEDQRRIAERCVALLGREPGATIFGSHVGAPEPGIYNGIGGPDRKMFCHSPESWETMWTELFGDQRINVTATLEEANDKLVGTGPQAQTRRALIWSVTVL